MVTILHHPTAHPKGIVGYNSPNHGAINAVGVWPNLVVNQPVVSVLGHRQYAVHLPTNQTRFHSDFSAIVLLSASKLRCSLDRITSQIAKTMNREAQGGMPRHSRFYVVGVSLMLGGALFLECDTLKHIKSGLAFFLGFSNKVFSCLDTCCAS